MTRAAQAIIDLQAIQHNLSVVRRYAPQAKIMAVIKSNAYGHGMLRLIPRLTQVDAIAVACLEEALSLREAGVLKPIVLLEGFSRPAELTTIAQQGLTPLIHHFAQIEMLERSKLAKEISVWLKIDSGMHRLGIAPDQARQAWTRLMASPYIIKPIGLLTHLACADDRQDTMTGQQLEIFFDCVRDLPGERSIANSAGMIAWPEARGDWVRPGIMLYGVSPFNQGAGVDLDLKPVMTLQSRLIAINHYRKGESIGYGRAYVCPEDMPIGVIAAGYGDGYPRHAVMGTPVLLNGMRLPLVGRVSMDMLMIDLRHQSNAQLGDMATLWGRGLPVEEVARHAGTIPYQLLCNLGSRVRVLEYT